jgi:hypothetical protein
MYSGNLINELIAIVERAEARVRNHYGQQAELACWGAVVSPGAPNYQFVNQNLAGVA